MVKADIIRSIELKLGLSHEEASQQVEQVIAVIKKTLEDGDSVLISGFGQWKVRDKKKGPLVFQ
ncbi:MAG: HU family DNA-binding protein [SAR324 cluster bacterium]|nr:HU family DNA-binding protein [SAR324 cluster bacterium]